MPLYNPSVTEVFGTTNRITVATGTTTPVIDISATFEALLFKLTGGTISGSILVNANNTLDLGASGTGFRTAYLGTSLVAPLIIGGTSTTQTLTYKTTTGVGASGADHIFQVGNNGGTEAMRILNSGNVGIGVSPSAKFHVKTSGEIARLETTGNVSSGGAAYISLYDVNGLSGYLGYTGFANQLDIYSTETGPIAFWTGASQKMTILSGGNVGIGVTSPTALLHLKAGTATANTLPLLLTTGISETTARAGAVQYSSGSSSGIQAISGSRFTLTESDTTERFILQAATSVKTTAAAPYTNDGFVSVVINGTTVKLMTTA